MPSRAYLRLRHFQSVIYAVGALRLSGRDESSSPQKTFSQPAAALESLGAI